MTKLVNYVNVMKHPIFLKWIQKYDEQCEYSYSREIIMQIIADSIQPNGYVDANMANNEAEKILKDITHGLNKFIELLNL